MESHNIKESIVGIWTATDRADVRVSTSMRGDNQVEFSIGKNTAKGTWHLDDTADPIQLDFHIDSEDHLIMRMIIRLLSKNMLQIRIDDSNTGSRPTNFLPEDDKDSQLTLSRIG